MTDQAIYNILAGYAVQLGVKVAPHDLRRTFAQLARKRNAPIEKIQINMGHASVKTTEDYLGTRQDLQNALTDRVALRSFPLS